METDALDAAPNVEHLLMNLPSSDYLTRYKILCHESSYIIKYRQIVNKFSFEFIRILNINI